MVETGICLTINVNGIEMDISGIEMDIRGHCMTRA